MHAGKNVRVINNFVCHGVNVFLLVFLLLFFFSLLMYVQKQNNSNQKRSVTCHSGSLGLPRSDGVRVMDSCLPYRPQFP